MAWVVRKHEGSLSKHGCYPGAREIGEYIRNGVIILDKPPGPTSNDVDKWVKDILQLKKVSHGGTLDPRVSGVLPLALENTTKLMPILLTRRKEYVGLISLHELRDESKIRHVFRNFIGKVKQLPPLKSAVARREREREIYDLEILEIDERNILFRIETEAGFYVRRFAVDIGKKLGTKAHLQELRRIRSGRFTEDKAKTLHDLVDALDDEDNLREIILPMEIVVEDIGKVIISDNAVDNICNGAPLAIGGIVRYEDDVGKDRLVAIFTLKGELVAIGKSLVNFNDIENINKGLAVKTDRVLMKKGTYASSL